jgi:hypothetical protein
MDVDTKQAERDFLSMDIDPPIESMISKHPARAARARAARFAS